MIWMDVDTALAEIPVNAVPLIDDTDFKTIETGVAYNAAGMSLYWHFVTTGGSYTATAVTPTTGGSYDWAHQNGGMYTIEMPASGGASVNNDTEGFGWFTGVATGVLPWRGPTIGFRAAAINNALIDGGDVLDVSVTEWTGTAVATPTVAGVPEVDITHIGGSALSTTTAQLGVNVVQLSGDATAADNAEAFFDGTGYAGTGNTIPTVTTVTTTTNLTNLPTIPANWLTAAGTAADFTTEIQSGLATAAALATAQADLDILTGADGANIATGAITAASIATGAIDADSIAADAGVEIASAVWDRVLSAANHNIANSAGRRLRQIDASFVVHAGTAQAGSATTITLDTGASTTNNIYRGDRVVIVGGTGIGENALITGYVGSTRVATVTPSFVITPDATSEFEIVPAMVDVEAWTNNAVTGDGDWNELQTDVDAILVDTNELQTDWVDGGRLDLLLDGKPTLAQILAGGDVDGYTLEETLKLCLAALAGKLSGAATTTITIRSADDSANRIVATVDADGNRSAITLNAAG